MFATVGAILGGLRNTGTSAIRIVSGGILALLAMVLMAAPATAQTITGATVSPSTYNGIGQTITFTVTVNSGSRVASSATVTSQVGANYTCPIADTVNTGVTFTCTGTKTTTTTNVSNLMIQEQPVVRLVSLGTPTIMTYGGILQSTYVAPPAPTVTSLSPANGPEVGGTSVTITGTNFTGASAVSFGTVSADGFTVNSATSITAYSPPGTGTVNVRVTTAGGTSATGAGNQFIYGTPPAPTITSLSPNVGSTAGGETVIITGTNFIGVTQVRFGAGIDPSYTVDSPTQITAISPSRSSNSTANVFVVAAGGSTGVSAASEFTFVAPPTITSITPTTGPTSGGTVVSITGTNLSRVSAVRFGATPASSFTVNSSTSITATAPAGTGNVRIGVTSPGGTGESGLFTYADAIAPAISTHPTFATVTAGNNASFTAAASGTPTPTVQWQVSTDNGGTFNNVSGATSTTLSFATVAGDNGKQYRAVFTNSAGTATTNSATLFIQTVPVITTQPVGATVAPGQTITMTAAATGTPTPTAAWFYSEDGGANFINVSNQPSFSATSPVPVTALVKVVFTNAAGSVTSNTVTLEWVKQNQTISFTSAAPSAATFGGPTYTVAATATSGLGVSYTIDASASGVCSIAGSTVSFIGVGTCTINANQAGNTVYNAAPQVQQVFAVGQGANVITFPALSNTPFTSAPPALSATASSGLAVSYASNSGAVCTVSGGAISFVAAGTCSITASQAGNVNYAAASPVTNSFEVTPGANAITFPALANTAFTSAPPALSATASSGLAVSYASNSASVCTVTGGTISFIAAGTCSITASQAGNANYAAANPVTNTFEVTPGVNTITFAALPNRALGSGSFGLTSTASSGLTVAFTSSTPATCSVSGSTVNLLAVGTCTILANQAGNANYQAAPQVSQSFQITQAVTTVGLTSSASSVFFGMPVTLTATVSGVSPTGSVQFNDGATVLGTSALSGGTASFTTSSLAAGTHSLTATYLGDARNLPGTSAAISVTVNARPNPAQDPDTRSSVDSQFRMSERFVRTQMDNVEGRLDQLHNDGEDQDSMNLRFSQTRPQWRNGIPGGSQNLQGGTIGYGYSYSNAQPASGGEALLSMLNPNAAWLPGAPMGMAPVAMGGGNGGDAAGTHRAAGESLERRLFRIWASGDINFGKEQPNGGVEQRFTSTGITVGMDGKFSSNLKLGAAFGFGWDNARIGTNGSENDATNGSLTFYGSWRVAPKLFIDGLVGQGYGTINTTRFSTTGAVFLDGKRRTSQTYAALIGTYEGKLGNIEFAPYLRADGIWVHLSPYTETGSPFWALAFAAADENSFSGTVGAKARIPLGEDSGWKLTARGEYRTRISGDYTQLLGYADLQGTQGTPYAITGQGVSDSTFTGGLGLEGNMRNLMLRLGYDLTTMAGGNISNRISAAIGWKF